MKLTNLYTSTVEVFEADDGYSYRTDSNGESWECSKCGDTWYSVFWNQELLLKKAYNEFRQQQIVHDN